MIAMMDLRREAIYLGVTFMLSIFGGLERCFEELYIPIYLLSDFQRGLWMELLGVCMFEGREDWIGGDDLHGDAMVRRSETR